MASVGEIIRQIIESRNIPQGMMAKTLKVSQNFLSQVENNKKTVSFGKLEEMAVNLGISKELILIAASDIPSELSDHEKEMFIEMQSSIQKYISLNS